jgi:hypothetical protein
VAVVAEVAAAEVVAAEAAAAEAVAVAEDGDKVHIIIRQQKTERDKVL